METTSRFTLGLDLDGVTADYFGALRSEILKRRPHLRPSLSPKSYDFSLDQDWGFPDRTSFLEMHNNLVDSGFFLTLQPMPHAQGVLKRLSDAEVSITILTHRFHRHGANARAVTDTVNWLDKWDIPYRAFAVTADKTAVVADLYVDDAPHNIKALEAECRPVVVFDQEYNRDVGTLRAKTWLDLEDIVLERQAQWKRTQW